MAPPPDSESSNTTIRPELFIRAKSGTISESITDAFTSIPSRFRRRQPSESPSSSSSLSNRPSHTLSKMMSKITLKDIQGAKRCGGDGFGTVRIYEHPTKGKVALKQLFVSRGQEYDDIRRRTLREGEIWQDLDHPHVLPFLGILETPTELYLVSPYVENGPLNAYLRRNPYADRRIFLMETAGAIAFLHECGIVHGDIKATNILVSNDRRALLCDFGLAKSDDGTTSVGLQGVGTVRYQSPEVLQEGGGKSFASDVWAFGMTISEVLSGNIPFHQYKVQTAVIAAVITKDERPPTSPSRSPSGASYAPVWSVAQECWQRDPELRPPMNHTHRRLRHGVGIRGGHPDSVQGVAFSPDGMTIASGSWERSLCLCDVASGRQRAELPTGSCSQDASPAFSADGKTVVAAVGRTLQLWDVASGRRQGEVLEGHSGVVMCVAFSPDGMTIVSGSLDHTLRLWDPRSGSQIGETLKGHTDIVYCLAFSPDGRTIVSGSRDTSIRLWDVASGCQRGDALVGHTDVVRCIVFSSDGKTFASGSEDCTPRLWDVESGSGRELKGHTQGVACLAFSPDGKTIVSGSWDQTLRLWDVVSGSQRGETLKGHTSWVTCLAFSPDGKTIASGSIDKTLRLWDPASGNQRGEALKGHTGAVWCLSFSPDGETIVSGSGDRTLRLWAVDP